MTEDQERYIDEMEAAAQAESDATPAEVEMNNERPLNVDDLLSLYNLHNARLSSVEKNLEAQAEILHEILDIMRGVSDKAREIVGK